MTNELILFRRQKEIPAKTRWFYGLLLMGIPAAGGTMVAEIVDWLRELSTQGELASWLLRGLSAVVVLIALWLFPLGVFDLAWWTVHRRQVWLQEKNSKDELTQSEL